MFEPVRQSKTAAETSAAVQLRATVKSKKETLEQKFLEETLLIKTPKRKVVKTTGTWNSPEKGNIVWVDT